MNPHDVLHSTQYLPHIPRADGTCALPQVQTDHPQAKGAVRLEICVFVRPGRYTLLMRCASCIDTAMAKAILNVYTSASRVPAEPSVDPASAARVRGRITMCSKRVVGAATKTLEDESCPRTSCQP